MTKTQQFSAVNDTKKCNDCKETDVSFHPKRAICIGCYNKNRKIKRDMRKIENENEKATKAGSIVNSDEEFALILSETKEIRDLVLDLRDVNVLLRNENQELKEMLCKQNEDIMKDVNTLRNETQELREILRRQKEDIGNLKSRVNNMSTENTSVDIDGDFNSMFNKRIGITDNNHNFLRSRVDDLIVKMDKLAKTIIKIEQSEDSRKTVTPKQNSKTIRKIVK